MEYWNSYVNFYDTYIDELFKDMKIQIELFLLNKKYSSEVDCLQTIINCSPGLENAKLRNRFSRKEKYLFFDIIIPYTYYMNLTNAARRNCIAQSFLRDMEVLRKYKPKGFVLDEMKNDFKIFFQEKEWLFPEKGDWFE